jgi:copper(I)-binding protein
MRFCLAAILATCALMAPVAAASAAGQKPVTASKAWVKAPASGETSAAAFLTLENPGMYDIYVTSASTDAAGMVQLRAPGAGGGPPAPIKEAVVPAYDSLEMKPTGTHLWLTDLKRPLTAGDTITLVVVIDSGVNLQVQADVR